MTPVLITADPILHLLAAVLYAVAFALLLAELVLQKDVRRAVRTFAVGGLGVHIAGILVRWVAVGHGPVVTKYENLSAYALATAILGLYFAVRRSSQRQLGLALYPSAFLLLGLGLYSGPDVQNLPPTFTGIWLVLHVCFYFLAFGTAVTAVGASVLLMVRRSEDPESGRALPLPDELDRTAYRYAGLAFSFWGIGMLTGAIWAFHAWGRYWGWDPVETWSLATWLLFGGYLHVRRFYAWKDRRAGWLLILSFGFALISLFGTTIASDSLHSVYFK